MRAPARCDRPYRKLRIALGIEAAHKDWPTEITDDELRARLATWQPLVPAGLGFGGIAVLAWLMVIKPF